jgi:hypothetical protein
MARYPSTRDCDIDGCTRARQTGVLCAKHYALVPLKMRLDCAVACWDAQLKAAAEHHQLQLQYVAALSVQTQ